MAEEAENDGKQDSQSGQEMPQGVQGALLVPVLGIVDQGPWFGSGVRVTAGSFLGLLTRCGDLMKVTHFGLLAERGDLWKNIDGCFLSVLLVRRRDRKRALGLLY